jgi:cobalamin biosynthesis Mg chelatase CobN
MIGVRRRQARVRAHVLCLLSVLALLAFAFFPVAAGADSSEIQYSDAPPTVTGTKKPVHDETPAKTSKSQNGSNPSNTSNSKESHSPEGESSGSTSSKSDAVPPSSSNGDQNGGSGQGSQGQGSQGKSNGGVQQQNQAAKPIAATKDSGGGSSPLAPILIAIAALAAVSIGVVMLRQRRQRGTPAKTVSPKAS